MDRTRVFVERTGRRIAPFDDPIGETPILSRPLRRWQAEAFAGSGLVVSAVLQPPCLVVPDTLFASAGALRAFVDGARGEDAVLVLKRSEFARMTTPVQPGVREVEDGHLFETIRFVSGRDEPPCAVVVDPQERMVEVDFPRATFVAKRTTLGIPRDYVMTMHHWVHILWANEIAGPFRAWADPPRETVFETLRARVRARSGDPDEVRRARSTFGRGCDIHPTAVVEGSRLGNRVTVGPYASVMFSDLDDDVNISVGSDVQFSVFGRKAFLGPNGLAHFSVVHPDTVAGFMGQLSITGSGAVTAGVRIQKPEAHQPVSVELDGHVYSTGLHFLGAAYGYHSQLGGGTFVQAGSAIPNDYQIISEAPGSLSKIPAGLAGRGPLSVADGTLRPSVAVGDSGGEEARPV
ncbi:MAG: hypothetical protein AB7L91_04210 [Dehalococcoidia bacterium]